MRKTTGSEDSKTNESMIGLNKTSYSSTDNQNVKINQSNSGSTSFNANSSYLSENNAKKTGNLSPTLPYANNQIKPLK